MAIVKSQKFLPASSSSSLTVRSKTISSSTFTAATPGTGSKKLFTLKRKIIEVDKILKGTLASEKKSIDQKKKEEEKDKRKSSERSLEAKPKRKESGGNKLKIPTPSFFDRIKDFFKNIIAGYILTRLVDFANVIEPFLPAIGKAFDWTANFVIGLVDGLGTFLVWGQDAANSSKQFLKETFGEDAVARFNKLGDKLFDLFNAIVIVGSLSAAMRGPKKPGPGIKPSGSVKPTKPLARTPGFSPTGPQGAARKIQIQHGHAARGVYQNAYDNAIAKGKSPAEAIRRANASVKSAIKAGNIVSAPQKGTLAGGIKGSSITSRGSSKMVGRAGLKLFGKAGTQLVKKTFGRIPIMGALIVGVSSLLAGEPIGQALFKAFGSALGGLLGSFIPIPVIGTVFGTMIGEFLGDVLYSLIMGGGPGEAGKKFMEGLKGALEVGGLIVNFFKEGFGRFFKDYPTVDVSDFAWGALQKGLAFLFPFLDKDGDGKVQKMPDIGLLFNPIMGIAKLIPHAAASFLPGIFGKDGTAYGVKGNKKLEPPSTPSSTGGGGREPVIQSSAGTNQGMASGEIRNKNGKAIYLHWNAINHTSTGGPYHTVFTGDGAIHRKTEYDQSTGGHTYGRNSNAVGLALAANPDIGQWPTEAQKTSMAKEAARIAKGWGWSASDIGINKIMTHGEAGSNLDGVVRHTNYGLFGRGDSRVQKDKEQLAKGSIAAFERWDLDIMKPGAIYGTGGDEMRQRIKGFMRLGGPTQGKGMYVMGEEGKEFVIDADSTAALEGAFPGFLNALNKADGRAALDVLRSYAEYESNSPQVVVVEKVKEVVRNNNYAQKSSMIPIFSSSMSEDPFEFLAYQG